MENPLKVYNLMIFLSLFVCLLSMRVKRREGDQAPQGYCKTYKWGGISRLHWYTCCNNCGTSDKSCDGIRYQSASSREYCGTCGDTRGGHGKLRATYSCGGCQGQNRTQEKCLEGFRSVYEIKGLCWAFAKCFKSKCRSRSKGSAQIPDMCFNMRCDHGETVDNCPTDCCGTVSAKCDWRKVDNKTCLPECCGESTCCNGTSGSDGLVSKTTYYISLVTLTKFALVKYFNNFNA